MRCGMKYLYLIIIGILLALALWLYLRPHQEPVIDVKQVKTLQDKVKKAEQIKLNVIVKAREDSAKQAVITKAKDKEIARLKQAVRKYRTPHVDTVLIQDKEVGRYAAFLDSIVVNQDTLIASLKEQKVSTWRDFNALISASDSVATANKELNKHFQSSLEEAKEANKKLTRQNRGLKVGIIAVPVVILGILASK
jgi:acylphosphatase